MNAQAAKKYAREVIVAGALAYVFAFCAGAAVHAWTVAFKLGWGLVR